jgi:hypothetical protein
LCVLRYGDHEITPFQTYLNYTSSHNSGRQCGKGRADSRCALQ